MAKGPKKKVVITDGGYRDYKYERGILEPVNCEIYVNEGAAEPLEEICGDAAGLLVRQSRITPDLIAVMPLCKVVARYGIGVDNVDIPACTEAGIVVANTPGFCVDDVSTHAIALLFSLIRRVVSHDRRIRGGEWDIGSGERIHRERGKTLGLVGFGSIPQCLHAKVAGFNFQVITHDPFIPDELAKAKKVTKVELDELCRQADYISVHAPLNAETRHLIGAEQFALMKPSAFIVNTSRGPVIDEEALIAALQAGRLAGAALDVYEVEPLPEDSPLRAMPNVVLSDHAGWYSEESLAELQSRAANAVASVLIGGRPESVVNPEVYKRPES
jgi:D-3-phosphoglycerate dehydrogenase